MKDNDPTAYFWNIAGKLLAEKGMSQGKILGFPCLRCQGEFVAAPEHRDGDLIVKLPAERVAQLIQQGRGALPFS